MPLGRFNRGPSGVIQMSDRLAACRTQLVPPDKLRGRMTSINMTSFVCGPQLGEVEAGMVAVLVGASLSVVTGDAPCLIAAAITPGSAKNLRGYQVS